MRRSWGAVLALALVLSFPTAAVGHHVELPPEVEEGLPTLPDGTTAQPAGSDADVHSENMILVANHDDGGTYRQGSDLAFWRNLAIAGNFSGFRVYDIANPARPIQRGKFTCPGGQGDVSIWKTLVFMSVDSPRTSGEDCSTANGASTAQTTSGAAWEGIRVVSIADPSNPVQVAAVDTDCGSHTHTLVPDPGRDRVLIYVLSYPLGGQSTECNALTHRKISVVEVPLSDPASASVISTPGVSPAVGCHDVTVFTSRKLAAAACITESQIWDISDPANPAILAHIVNPAINIHHSSTFSWDGGTLVIGDELGGAAVTPGCADGHEHLPIGALWFYDVSNPASPALVSSWRIPQEEVSAFCTAHNFNVVPMKSDRDVLVSAWYNGGTTVIDFTDPANVVQLGHYIAKEPKIAANWSSYWYRGFIFVNNYDEDVNSISGQSRGFDVLAISDKELKKDSIKLNRLNPQTMEPFRP
ncbi:MAG: hypothetical protein HY658_09650 [Actinobacteria bacterium]|nr:hypothetical protein [Actinomycetota bacterium]